jgi:hypothetical protein
MTHLVVGTYESVIAQGEVGVRASGTAVLCLDSEAPVTLATPVMPKFPRLKLEPKKGSEVFSLAGRELPHDVSSFWRWACSDLVGNSLRGLLAEYLVRAAIGAQTAVRVEWDAYDLQTPTGIKVEVKTSGYLQSWDQKQLSEIAFDIAPKRLLDVLTNTYSAVPSRPADVYVFAIHKHQDKSTVDPLDVDQWTFYVAPTPLLDARCGAQKTIGLSSLRNLLGPTEVGFLEIAQAIARAAPFGGPESEAPDHLERAARLG